MDHAGVFYRVATVPVGLGVAVVSLSTTAATS